MSWDAYVTSLLDGKARCYYAGIFGRQGGLWAESPNKQLFPITLEDVANVARVIASQDQSVMGTGLKIGGKLNFTCLRMEPDLLICQGKGDNKDHSLVIALSNQAVIVGFNPDAEIKTAYVRDAIEVMKDYLKTAGY